MAMTRVAGWTLIALTLLIVSASQADACTCASPGSACEALWQAGAVFAGEVLEIVDVGPKSERFPPAVLRIRFRVLETFAGVEAPGPYTEVYTAGHSAMCGYPFARGGRYLVFAYDYPDGTRGVSLCSATRPMGALNADLRYLRALKAAAPDTGRLRGRAMYFERPTLSSHPFADARIVARGGDDRTIEARTDSNGRFDLVAPVGRYTLEAVVDDRFYARVDTPRVWILDPGACGELTVRIRPDGHVSGRVLTVDGSPLAHVAVKVGEPKDAARLASSYGPFVRTDSFGRFDAGNLPPGQYVLGLAVPYVAAPKSSGIPILMSSEQGRQSVREISLSPGGRVDVGDFVVREIPRLVTVSGTVVDRANQALRDVSVQLTTTDKRPTDIGPPVTTDENGRFSFATVPGNRYGILARLYRLGMLDSVSVQAEILASVDAPPVTMTLPVQKPVKQ
jgi:hypothetical protein